MPTNKKDKAKAKPKKGKITAKAYAKIINKTRKNGSTGKSTSGNGGRRVKF